ncbi:MAG: hypothetical protein QW228_05950 [Candidatus Aenigmatarchaeota archaeon]
MEELILAFLGNAFFYVFLSYILPEKFAPLKILFICLGFFSFFGLFGILTIGEKLTIQTSEGNVTTIETRYKNEDAVFTITSSFMYVDLVALAITIVYTIIILLIEIFKPVQKVVERLK